MVEAQDNRIPVILNPKAKSEGAKSISEEVADFSYQIEVIETKAEGDARDIAERLAKAGAPLIVAAGGDGTVNEVVSGIALAQEKGKGVILPTLGILPLGTMNVFARELGIPCSDNLAAWAAIQSGLQTDVDLWMANDTPFVQMAGVGLDAEIIKRTTWKSKKILGAFSYIFTGLSLVGRTPPKLRIEFPGRDEPLDGCALVVGNGSLYGGALPFFPRASNVNGKLELLMFRELDSSVLLQLGAALVAHEQCDSSRTIYDRASEFTVTSLDDPQPFEVDGELVGETPIHFRPASHPLRVAIPPDPVPKSLPEIADEHFSN